MIHFVGVRVEEVEGGEALRAARERSRCGAGEVIEYFLGFGVSLKAGAFLGGEQELGREGDSVEFLT